MMQTAAELVEIDILKNIMREAAQHYLLPLFRNLDANTIHAKPSDITDVFTDADINAESYIVRKLQALYPHIHILGEELIEQKPEALELLKQDGKPYFVIDPIDGTKNFINGDPHIGMILSLVDGGEVIKALIYDPLQAHFMTAEKGKGAYDGDHKIDLSMEERGNTGFGKLKYFEDDLSAQFNKAALAQEIDIEILGCSAHEYMQFARGKNLFYFARNVKPWDHLAGSLIVREAGGVCKNWDGSDYTPENLGGSIMSAPSETLWQHYHKSLLQPIIPAPKLVP